MATRAFQPPNTFEEYNEQLQEMQCVVGTKVKITLTHSLPKSVQAMLTAHGKMVSSCTVARDATLQYFTYMKGCWAQYGIRGKALWAKTSFQICPDCSHRIKQCIYSSMWGQSLTSFFPKLNCTYESPYKHFTNTHQIFLAQLNSAKTLHMHFSSSMYFSHIFNCCVKLRFVRVATIFSLW